MFSVGRAVKCGLLCKNVKLFWEVVYSRYADNYTFMPLYKTRLPVLFRHNKKILRQQVCIMCQLLVLCGACWEGDLFNDNEETTFISLRVDTAMGLDEITVE